MVAFVNDIVKINFHHLKEDSLGRNHKLCSRWYYWKTIRILQGGDFKNKQTTKQLF